MELLTTKAYRDATWDQICEVCNGCGPKSWKYKIDKILFCNLFDACAIHDFDYSIPGDKSDKRQADVRFILNIIIILLHRNRSWWNVIRVPISLFFYVAVHFGGKSSFTWQEKGGD